MASKWKQVKIALGLHRCVIAPRTLDDYPPSSSEALSRPALLSPHESDRLSLLSPGFRLSRKGSKSTTQETCAICLGAMKHGGGHAIFTAECNHSFHFHCIASNVKHGNMICPVCRAKWKEIPLRAPTSDIVPRSSSVNGGLMTVVRRLPTRREMTRRNGSLHLLEPAVFYDDETLDSRASMSTDRAKTIDINTYTEVSAFDRRTSLDNFTVLINVKAASPSSPARAPVDIVTVLDVSGSMAGTKLGLLKKAMGFVIQNLGSNDRLSVVAFSSTASRLFPLRRMDESGRQQALIAVNALTANGGTNIAEGLKRGAKVMEERKEKNHVASIILLSDGQDSCTATNEPARNCRALLPEFHIPVHAFGFGADHDSLTMHAISQMSGGTFSFIENDAVLQDAFAQCIGGLLSVVAQEIQVAVKCANPISVVASLETGGYRCRVTETGRTGYVDIGDLYADEERDILVSINVPIEPTEHPTSLLRVSCVYKDPFSHEAVVLGDKMIELERSESSTAVVSVEVDRQKNRVKAAEAMQLARVAAEQGDLGGAIVILEKCRKALVESVSGVSGDRLCGGLNAELKEMQERMGSKHAYDASGRAYILSGLSSHSSQRATARGDSTDRSSLIQAYQTPSMSQMLSRSQLLLPMHR